MYELPFEHAIQRQARPKVVFGNLNPAKNLGITAGFPHGAGNPAGQMERQVAGGAAERMAGGGIMCYDDGGFVDDAASSMNYDMGLPSGLDAMSGADYNMNLPSRGSLYYPNSDDYKNLVASSSPNDGSLAMNPDGSATYSAPKGNGSQQTGLAGWLSSPHWGGINGSTYLKAGLTALAGILSGIGAKKANQSSIAGPSFNAGQVPSFGNIGLAKGGPVRMAPGGMAPPSGGAPGGGIMAGGDPMAGAGAQPEDQQSQAIVSNAIKALIGQSQNPQADIQAFVQHFGQDALQQLVQMVQQGQGAGPSMPLMTGAQQAPPGAASGAGGGILSGPGDGMSDSIPANNGQVRVADGEYVVPADAVSQLGNGSTQAGARKLDAGVANLRKQKYGSSKQPSKLRPNSNPILGQK